MQEEMAEDGDFKGLWRSLTELERKVLLGIMANVKPFSNEFIGKLGEFIKPKPVVARVQNAVNRLVTAGMVGQVAVEIMKSRMFNLRSGLRGN